MSFETTSYINIPAFNVSGFMVWQEKFGEWEKSQPGFQARTVLNSYSYPTHYVSIARWESRAAARTALTSAGYEKFLAANSSDEILTPRRPYEAYEAALLVGDTTKVSSFVFSAEWYVEPWNGPALEKYYRDLWELMQKAVGGFGFGRLYRMLGNSSRFLATGFYTNREEHRMLLALPELREFQRAHPYTEYAAERPAFEQYEVILTTQA
jgi:heme-degrading monooxygenase HmoA